MNLLYVYYYVYNIDCGNFFKNVKGKIFYEKELSEH